MKVIITGGTGLIGSALVRSLARDQHEVIILSRAPESHSGGLPSGVRLVKWDSFSAEGWGHLADGADAIVNLAGESIAGDSLPALITKRWTAEQKKGILSSRLNAGRAVTQAIEAAHLKPRVLIQASAVGYYGDRGDELLPESAGPGSDFLAEVCIQWEQCTAAVEAFGVRRPILRTAGVVMSTQGGSLPFMLLPFRFFAGGPLGSGRQWMSWIHIDDHIRAIRFLIDHPTASGPFNINAPQSLPNSELSRTIGKVMHRPAFIPAPAFFFNLAFGEKAVILLSSQRQIPERLPALGFNYRFPQSEAALKDLLAA